MRRPLIKLPIKKIDSRKLSTALRSKISLAVLSVVAVSAVACSAGPPLAAGSVLWLFHNDKAALACFTRAAEIAPDCADAFDMKSRCLKHSGRLKEALDAANRNVALNPDACAYRHRASIEQ